MAAGASIRNPELVRSILRDAVDRHEVVIVLTPYLRFESHFLRLDEDGFQVSATMTKDDALYGLKSADLRFRFPHRTVMYEAATRLLGLGVAEGRRSLRLVIPDELRDDDHRGAYRVDRVGRVVVTFSTKKFDLMTGALLNLSVSGARVQSHQDLSDGAIEVGHDITVTIPLTETIRINAYAKVRYREERVFGLQFTTELPEATLTPLSRWVFQKREEDRDRIHHRPGGEGGAAPAAASEAKGILFIGSSEEVASELAALLADVQPVQKAGGGIQGVKEGLAATPMLVLVHAPSLKVDDRKRLKMMVEPVPDKTPMLLLGPASTDVAQLQEFGAELKAVATYGWGPGKGPFLLRLIQGILRRHHGPAEGSA